LHRSADGGKTWNKIAGIPRLPSGYSLFFDVGRPGIVYLRTYGTYIESSEGDIYKSIDGGQSWTMVRIDSTSNVPIYFFALAPADPPVLFAGAMSHYVNDTSFRLLKSTDGGGSWQEASAGLPSEDASAISIAAVPDNPSILYVSISGRGVFKSTNGGASLAAHRIPVVVNAAPERSGLPSGISCDSLVDTFCRGA
jgi:photosystem II stability/assembly factor-like uncharacterized protein